MYRRVRSALVAALASLAMVLALSAFPGFAATAHAADDANQECTTSSTHFVGTGGQLDWAFKDSWVKYISNKGFDAHWTLDRGAKWDQDAQHWSFPVKQADYDLDKHQGKVEYGGLVHFYSHPWPGQKGKYLLDMTWSDPILQFTGKTGTLSMVITSRDLSTFQVVDFKRITLAHFDDIAYDHAKSVLSAKHVTFDGGAEAAFNHEYKDGTELAPFSSPVSFAPERKCVPKKTTPKTDGGKAPSAGNTDKGAGAKGDGGKAGADQGQKPATDGGKAPSAGNTDKGKTDQGQQPGKDGKGAVACTIDLKHLVGDTGSLAWGFKDSWQRYISMKAFDAHWQLSDGAGWDAAKKQWTWKVKNATFDVPKHDLRIQYQGTVHFLSHPAGDGSYLLDMKWIDPVYLYSKATGVAKIQMHVISRDENTQKYVDFGVIDFALVGNQKVSHPQTGAKFDVAINASKVTLTAAGAKVFGAYKEGQPLTDANVAVTLVGQKTCGNQAQNPGGNDQGGSGTGAAPANPGGNGNATQQPQGPAAQNPAAPSSPTLQLPPVTRPLLPPPPAPQQPAKKACTPDPNRMRVTGGSLSWGIRASFTTYIRGLAKGSWDLSGGVRWDGSHFVFPAGSGTYNKATRQGTINYGGAIHFTGHHGVLNLKLWNPTLQINGNQATLYLSGSSTDMSGKPVPVGRVAFATLRLDNLSVNGSKLTFSASDVHLTAAGTKAFAGFYKTGEKLDGLSGTADLVMATSCDADGNLLYYGADGKWHKGGGGLAKTGTQAGALLSLSSLLVAAGCVALATRRRRRDRVA